VTKAASWIFVDAEDNCAPGRFDRSHAKVEALHRGRAKVSAGSASERPDR
jgi:hypothetical protein